MYSAFILSLFTARMTFDARRRVFFHHFSFQLFIFIFFLLLLRLSLLFSFLIALQVVKRIKIVKKTNVTIFVIKV
jgi:hypothetical protein